MTPDQVAAKWLRNVQGATQAYKDGIDAVQDSPMEAAAARKDAYVAGVRDNADKWQERLQAVSLAAWKKITLKKGGDRYATGAQEALPKVQQFMRRLLPYTAEVSKTVKAMPNNTLEDSIARARKAIEMMKAFGREVLPAPRG